jgi:hypothetical protein
MNQQEKRLVRQVGSQPREVVVQQLLLALLYRHARLKLYDFQLA